MSRLHPSPVHRNSKVSHRQWHIMIVRLSLYDRVSQPSSDSYASLMQAQESYLQFQQAQADTPDIRFLQVEVDGAHEEQSEASKGTLRQIFPGVDKEVLGWVLEESEGQLEEH